MADMLHIIHQFGGVENLKGKKIAMTWAYSPSYGKPLSVPQGVIGLMTRFGMDVVLAHPEGYEVMPEVEEVAKTNAAEDRRHLHQDPLHGRGLPGRRHRVPQELGSLRRHGEAHQPVRRRRQATASRPWRRSCWPRTPQHKDWCLHRGADEDAPATARPCTCTACPPTSTMSPAWTARWRPPCSTATAIPCTRRPPSSPISSPP